jgi:hypothetical protein
MIPSSIQTAERELRRVIERLRAEDVAPCLAAYGETVQKQVEPLLPSDPVRFEICESVRALLDWATLMLYTRRSVLAEELRALQRTHCFLGAEQRCAKPASNPGFRLDF